MDEHRIGLGPILRRIWAPKGATVKAPVAQRYEWMYVFAFVHPQSGQTCWLLLPSVNTEIFSRALAAFAKGGWEQDQTNPSCWFLIGQGGRAVLT
jgi:hypothetical protein